MNCFKRMGIELLFLSQPRALKPGQHRSYTVLKWQRGLGKKPRLMSQIPLLLWGGSKANIFHHIFFCQVNSSRSHPLVCCTMRKDKNSELCRDQSLLTRKMVYWGSQREASERLGHSNLAAVRIYRATSAASFIRKELSIIQCQFYCKIVFV